MMEYLKFATGLLTTSFKELYKVGMFTLVAGCISVAPSSVAADELQPDRPVTLVIGFGAGGTMDVIARAIAAELQERIGNSVIVESRTGASGVIANEHVINSDPDGHTLVVGGAGTFGLLPAVRDDLPYDPETAFTALARIADFPLLMVVPASMPVNNVDEFREYLKSNPGPFTFGSTGVGTTPHLIGHTFASNAGVEMTHVPYRDAGIMRVDLMEGRLDVIFDPLASVIGMVNDGLLKPLATSTPDRIAQLPDVPTMEEVGLEGISYSSWAGVFGPANMDPAVVQYLSQAIAEASLGDEGSRALMGLGAIPVGEQHEEFDSFWRSEMAAWKKMAEAAGLAAE
jgi:tripartite-type tricarboxylate transporter receptor subunit TctC